MNGRDQADRCAYFNDQGDILKSIEFDFDGKLQSEVLYIYNIANTRIEKELFLESHKTSETIYQYNNYGKNIKKLSMEDGKIIEETSIIYNNDCNIREEISTKDGEQTFRITYSYSDKTILTEKEVMGKESLGAHTKTFQCDKMGLLIQVRSSHFNGRFIDAVSTEKWLYLNKRLVNIDSEFILSKGSTSLSKTTFELNDDGFPVKKIFKGKMLNMETSGVCDYRDNEIFLKNEHQ